MWARRKSDQSSSAANTHKGIRRQTWRRKRRNYLASVRFLGLERNFMTGKV